MGKKPWTTDEQYAWLEPLLSDFTQAQDDKTTKKFLQTTYAGWHAKWPTPAPTKDEIRRHGSLDIATAEKKKAAEEVHTTQSLKCFANVQNLPRVPARENVVFQSHQGLVVRYRFPRRSELGRVAKKRAALASVLELVSAYDAEGEDRRRLATILT